MLTGFNQPILIASCAGAVYAAYSDANATSGDRMYCFFFSFFYSKWDAHTSFVLLNIFH